VADEGRRFRGAARHSSAHREDVAEDRAKGWDKPKEADMGRVIVMNGVTLDGVMQGLGRPDEDTRDGFERGGWAVPYADEAMVAKMGERMGGDHAFLFGRRTYEDLLASWNAQGGPFKDALNNARKYVASSNTATRLDWPNSTLLSGDVPAAVADLKQSAGTNLVIMGSGVLIGSLMAAELIDEYLLTIYPLVLGTGRRLFPGGTLASLRLVESSTTSTGVLIAIYESARVTALHLEDAA
jgi:dihydrofolate reductase